MAGILAGASVFFDSLMGASLFLSDYPEAYKVKDLPAYAAGSRPAPSAVSSGKKEKDAKKNKDVLSPKKRQQIIERGAAELMILFQREGRLIDFLDQSIDDFDDEDVGAAVREVHKGCRKVFQKHFEVDSVLKDKEEDDEVEVEKGFNPEEIRLLGNVKGDPPFKGTLRHPGWRAKKVTMPKVAESVDTNILAAAEVEV